MSVLALLLAAQASVPSEPYPLEAVLDFARSTCTSVVSMDSDEESLVAESWSKLEVPRGSWLGNYIAENRKIGPWFKTTVSDLTLTRTVHGRQLILYLFTINDPERNSRENWGSCEIIDGQADGDISFEAIVNWSGRDPIDAFPLDFGGMVTARWVPGFAEGSMDSAVTFGSPNAPLGDLRPGLIYSLVMKSKKATLAGGAIQ